MVFDLSAESSKKKPAKPIQKMPSQSTPSGGTEDAQEILKRITMKHQELVKKTEETFRKANVDPLEFKKYCQDPAHFSPSQWEHFQQKKEEIEVQITGLTKEMLKGKKKKTLDAKASKSRKGKMLGARKQWLNMH